MSLQCSKELDGISIAAGAMLSLLLYHVLERIFRKIHEIAHPLCRENGVMKVTCINYNVMKMIIHLLH